MSKAAPSIFMVAGEASGDLHGARLAAKLIQLLPHANIRGIGGRHMQEAGVELLFHSSSWSAIGVAEALKVAPSLLLTFRKMLNLLRAHPPDLLILIDFGAFNVRLGSRLRSTGTKVLYFFPPGSWRREATYEQLKGIPDWVVTPFPWSAEALRQGGFRADFFGHPLLDSVRPSLSRDQFCQRFGFDTERPIIGLLPGSRSQEIAHNLPALVIAAARLAQSIPELQFAIPVASSINAGTLQLELGRVPWLEIKPHMTEDTRGATVSKPPTARRIRALAREEGFEPSNSRICINLMPGMSYDVLAHSRAAIVASGTATLEAAILGCPMVIIYRGDWFTVLEYKLRSKSIRFIGMPNIILDRMACTELIDKDASPGRISGEVLRLIPNSPDRNKMLNDLEEVKAVLGRPGATEKTARVVLELLSNHG